MAGERHTLAVSVPFLSRAALAATVSVLSFFLSLLLMQNFRQRQLIAQATQQHNATVARLRRIRRRINRRDRMWRSSCSNLGRLQM